jgi:hypothetical protein
MRKFFLLCTAALLATGFSANNANAQFGIGYLYQDFPVGIFYDMDGSYLSVGVHFDHNDVASGSNALQNVFGAAAEWMMDMKSGDSWGFGPAIGGAVTVNSYEGSNIDSGKLYNVMLGLKGHWDPTSNTSFWMGEGLRIDINSPGNNIKSTTNFSLEGFNIADLGFTWWMP